MISEKYISRLDSFKSTGLMLYFNYSDVELCERIIAIAYRYGVRVIEFSHSRDHRSFNLFSYLLESSKQYPDLCFGAGTVLNAKIAEMYSKRGAHFIASPFLHDDMARLCETYGTIWIPGCQSINEIDQAKSLGAEIVSVLPANDIAHQIFISQLQAYRGVHFIPSAAFNVTEENLSEWMDAQALCIRMGPSVLSKETIAIREWSRLEKNIYTAMAMIKNGKKKSVSQRA